MNIIKQCMMISSVHNSNESGVISLTKTAKLLDVSWMDTTLLHTFPGNTCHEHVSIHVLYQHAIQLMCIYWYY